MIAVLPVLLYPVAGFGVLQVALGFLRQTHVVGVAGIENLQVHKGSVAGTAPMLTELTFPSSIQAGRTATLGGRVVDPDEGDTLTLSVDWGDGSASDLSKPGRKPFHRSHRYAAAGTYTVRVIWTDTRTGASNFRDLIRTVALRRVPSGRMAALHRA